MLWESALAVLFPGFALVEFAIRGFRIRVCLPGSAGKGNLKVPGHDPGPGKPKAATMTGSGRMTGVCMNVAAVCIAKETPETQYRTSNALWLFLPISAR